MVVAMQNLGRTSLVQRLNNRSCGNSRTPAPRALIVRNVVSGTPTPAGGKKLSIALGVAAAGAGALALAVATADQGTDVVQLLSHYPLELWGFYQTSIIAYPLQSKVC